MNKVIYGLTVIVLVVGGWYWFAGMQSTPTLSKDVYPLYEALSWGPVQEKSVTDGPAAGVASEPIIGIHNLSEHFEPFVTYYDDVLTKSGWVRDDSRAGAGPGAEVIYYTKRDKFVIVSYSTIFQNQQTDAPAECPCDLQFFLTSGTQVGLTPAQAIAKREYHDETLGFMITLPTEISETSGDTEYSVDPEYRYVGIGEGKDISGVKFTIPSSVAAGTNLSEDSYISVEHLAPDASCSAVAFMSDKSVRSHSLTEDSVSYSVASSVGAAAGNRYKEIVYARKNTNPCIAIRYFIHYGAIENYPDGQVQVFDEDALVQQFDQVRRTMRMIR